MSSPSTTPFRDPAAPATTKVPVGLTHFAGRAGDHLVPGGMTLADLRATAEVLAGSEIVGVEVGELESAPDDQTPPSYVTALLDALAPLLATTS